MDTFEEEICSGNPEALVAKIAELEAQLAQAHRDALLEAARKAGSSEIAMTGAPPSWAFVKGWLEGLADKAAPTDERVDKVWP